MSGTDNKPPMPQAMFQGILGGVAWLCQFSELHVRYPLGALKSRFIPSIALSQFRYYTDKDGKPVGFVNWAWLTAEAEEKFKTGTADLEFEDWKAGDRLWFPEILAPFGHGQDILYDLRENVFPEGTVGHAVYVNPDGSFRRVQKFQ